MAPDPCREASLAGALTPLAAGPLISIAQGMLQVDIAPDAGGRIAQIRFDGVEQLVGPEDGDPAMIAWGSYPMAPWAGRVRDGRFDFEGRRYRVPLNLGNHAVHGIAFGLSWRVEAQSSRHVELTLQLPEDRHWPFGGALRQHLEAGERSLRMEMSATAGKHSMPVVIGWHPWFRKPDRVAFSPSLMYPTDADGISTSPPVAPSRGPWDHCFLNRKPVHLHRGGQVLRLTSDCSHWVVYDQTPHATCIEPQSGPPDAFNLDPVALAPGEALGAWFLIEWL
jgi:aldose 1-epimerase